MIKVCRYKTILQHASARQSTLFMHPCQGKFRKMRADPHLIVSPYFYVLKTELNADRSQEVRADMEVCRNLCTRSGQLSSDHSNSIPSLVCEALTTFFILKD